MERTPNGTAVGVDDPYAYVDRCDHISDDGRCRLAIETPGRDPEFAEERATEEYRCLALGSEEPEWDHCPQFRSRQSNRECIRCGLVEKRIAQTAERPLLEEHHLSYADGGESHEITVYVCRWCHAKVHSSWARLSDSVSPDPEAIAELEHRRGRELAECSFESAADRFDRARTSDE